MRTSELRVVLICLLCVANSEPNPPRLSCYPGKLCTELDRVAWLEKRKQVQKLTELLKKTPESEIYSDPFIVKAHDSIFGNSNDSLHTATSEQESFNDLLREYLAKQRKFMNFRSELCQDKHTAGFLLKAESDTWPLACLWTASDINGTCAPAPSRDSNFDYINAIEWRNEVRKFREAIRCWPYEKYSADYINELYICRQHCMQAGVNYMLALLITLSLVLAFGALCL